MPVDRTLSRHLATFSGAYAIGVLAPLVTTPYLARALGPTGWAPVLVAQGVTALLVLVLEYGFDLSATQALAGAESEAARAHTIRGVLAARMLLVPIGTLLLLCLSALIPSLGRDARLVGWTLAAAIARGFSPLWIFQGLGSPERAVVVEAAGKAAAAAGVFFVVHRAGDGWRVLALQAATSGITSAVLLRRPSARWGEQPLSFRDGWRVLREGWTVFAFRGAGALYLHANVLLVGALASPVAVAMYGGAERLVRSGINLLAPLTQALFPRVSRAVPHGAAATSTALREAAWILGGAGGLLSLVLLVGARPLVALLLGDAYAPVVPLVRGLAALPTLVAVGTVLGIHWAIPTGRAPRFLRIVLVAGVINLVTAIALIPHLGPWGMIAGATAAEAWVAGALWRLYRQEGRAA